MSEKSERVTMNHLEMLDFIKDKLSADVVKLEVGNYIFANNFSIPEDSYAISIIKGYQFRVYLIHRDSPIESEAKCLVRLAEIDFQSLDEEKVLICGKAIP